MRAGVSRSKGMDSRAENEKGLRRNSQPHILGSSHGVPSGSIAHSLTLITRPEGSVEHFFRKSFMLQSY